MKIELYLTHAVVLNSQKWIAVEAVMREANLQPPSNVTISVEQTMRLARGRANPVGAFVLLINDTIAIRDVFELFDFIDDAGLRPM